MKYYILSGLIFIQLISCKTQDAPPAANQNIEALQSQFQGKYRITTAVSSEALDVNQDGLLSTDLLTEIEELRTGTLTDPYSLINIYGPSKLHVNPSFI
ncbi:MAG: hypothetical protein ABIN24_01365, partial [Dyadobacter sp.]